MFFSSPRQEPSVNYLEALAPFQPLQMKTVSVPIGKEEQYWHL